MSTPHVTLRPATLADLDAFEERFDSAAGTGPYQWFGHTSLRPLRDLLEERRLLRGAQNLLVVEADAAAAQLREQADRDLPGTTPRLLEVVDTSRQLARHDQLLLSLLRDEWRGGAATAS